MTENELSKMNAKYCTPKSRRDDKCITVSDNLREEQSPVWDDIIDTITYILSHRKRATLAYGYAHLTPAALVGKNEIIK